MTSEQFAYWLQGYSEICGGRAPTEKEWLVIQDHLKLVFNKVTPNRSAMHPVDAADWITEPYNQAWRPFPNATTTC